KGLTADFTYNTDFAQVEEDEAQVNLTRFNLVFPEKREFFLEGAGAFTFGTPAVTTGGPPPPPGTNPAQFSGDAPALFYSRRIGLSGSRAVPIVAGARLSGKACACAATSSAAARSAASSRIDRGRRPAAGRIRRGGSTRASRFPRTSISAH